MAITTPPLRAVPLAPGEDSPAGDMPSTRQAAQSFTGVADTGHPLTNLVLGALDDLKAEAIVTFDLRGRSNVCDFMVIASGRSTTHVNALGEALRQTLKANRVEVLNIAGQEQSDWIVFDANNVVVHLFRPEVRAFYQLERMWDPAFAAPDPLQEALGDRLVSPIGATDDDAPML